MNAGLKPDYSDVLHPGVPVDVGANIAPLIRGKADPTAATHDGVSWLSFQPPSTGPISLAIIHPPSPVEPGEIRYHLWAAGHETAIHYAVDRMPVLLGVDEQSLAGWPEVDELLAQTAHLLPGRVARPRRRHRALR